MYKNDPANEQRNDAVSFFHLPELAATKTALSDFPKIIKLSEQSTNLQAVNTVGEMWYRPHKEPKCEKCHITAMMKNPSKENPGFGFRSGGLPKFKGQLQHKFFISINKLWLYQITIYVIKSLSKLK